MHSWGIHNDVALYKTTGTWQPTNCSCAETVHFTFKCASCDCCFVAPQCQRSLLSHKCTVHYTSVCVAGMCHPSTCQPRLMFYLLHSVLSAHFRRVGICSMGCSLLSVVHRLSACGFSAPAGYAAADICCLHAHQTMDCNSLLALTMLTHDGVCMHAPGHTERTSRQQGQWISCTCLCTLYATCPWNGLEGRSMPIMLTLLEPGTGMGLLSILT